MFSKTKSCFDCKDKHFFRKNKEIGKKTLLISKYYTNFADGKETLKLQNDKER